MADNIIYVATDPGKFDAKLGSYNAGTGKLTEMKFRAKISRGTFEDDMFEKGTFIVQVDDGPVYKVGYGGRTEPDMETSKKSEIHRICTLSSVAMACGCGDHPDVRLAVGVPYAVCENTEERHAYQDFIHGKTGIKHTVRIKTNCAGPVYTSAFTFTETKIYPEGIGPVYVYPKRFEGPTGVIDIGNVNVNYLYCDAGEPVRENCFTNEMGGKGLITGLSNTLTAGLGTRVDERIVASTLLKDYEHRHLVSASGNRSIDTKSREIIDQYLLEHVRNIKAACDANHWSLEFMNFVGIGGTSRLLQHELREVFGERFFIPERPEFVNARGFLNKLCADDEIDIISKVAGAEKPQTDAAQNA